AGNCRARAAHAMRSVANGAREAVVDMQRVLRETGVRDDVGQIVALAAQRVRAIHAQIRIRIEIRDQLARRRRLTGHVLTLENMCPLRPMRTIGTRTPEFTIVVAVVAIAAEYL